VSLRSRSVSRAKDAVQRHVRILRLERELARLGREAPSMKRVTTIRLELVELEKVEQRDPR
jgi:hypothetical protein